MAQRQDAGSADDGSPGTGWAVVLVCLFLNARSPRGRRHRRLRPFLRGRQGDGPRRRTFIHPAAAATSIRRCSLSSTLLSPGCRKTPPPWSCSLSHGPDARLGFLAVREFARRFGAPADAWKTAAVALLAVLLVADKLKGELEMRQMNLLMLFLFTAALRLLDRRPGLAGAVLGLAFNIKYLPIVFLPYLLLRDAGRPRPRSPHPSWVSPCCRPS